MMRKRITALLTVLLLVLSLLPVTASAADSELFSITNISGSSKFTITRENADTERTVFYRTISGTALEGVHFVEQHGALTFAKNEKSKEITIEEISSGAAFGGVTSTAYTNAARWYKVELYGSQYITPPSLGESGRAAERTMEQDESKNLDVNTLYSTYAGKYLTNLGGLTIHDYAENDIKWGYYKKGSSSTEYKQNAKFEFGKNCFYNPSPTQSNIYDYWVALDMPIYLKNFDFQLSKNEPGWYYVYLTTKDVTGETFSAPGSGKVIETLPDYGLAMYMLDSDKVANTVWPNVYLYSTENASIVSNVKSPPCFKAASQQLYINFGATGNDEDEFTVDDFIVNELSFYDTTGPQVVGVVFGNTQTDFYVGDPVYVSTVTNEVIKVLKGDMGTNAYDSPNVSAEGLICDGLDTSNVITHTGVATSATENGSFTVTQRLETAQFTDFSGNGETAGKQSFTATGASIKTRKALSDSTVRVDCGFGEDGAPTVAVRDTAADRDLICHEDYDLNYTIDSKAGTTTVVLEGLRGYTGTFTIDSPVRINVSYRETERDASGATTGLKIGFNHEFSNDPNWLTLADITVNGATATGVNYNEGVYTLAVKDVTVGDGGKVTVTINNSRYTVIPATTEFTAFGVSVHLNDNGTLLTVKRTTKLEDGDSIILARYNENHKLMGVEILGKSDLTISNYTGTYPISPNGASYMKAFIIKADTKAPRCPSALWLNTP